MNEKKYYRVSFGKYGCNYGRCFDTKAERDKFAVDMIKAGFKVSVYES